MDWGKFDKKVDVEALQKDVKAAKENDFEIGRAHV